MTATDTIDGVKLNYVPWNADPNDHRQEANWPDGIEENITKHLEPGWCKAEGKRPVQDAFGGINFEQAARIPMRDGVHLAADIYTPAILDEGQKVPAIVSFSPYGRSGYGGLNLHKVPYRCGVDEANVSGLEDFEGFDPVEWVARGYAIVNVDWRGNFTSEGNSEGVLPSAKSGKDGYDTTEWLAKQPWCNGKVGFAGNSQLAMVQLFIGAEQPPHLAALAPLEALHDQFRHLTFRGGIPNFAFAQSVVDIIYGKNLIKESDPKFQMKEHSFEDQWRDIHRAKLEKINVPLYILASYSTGLHTMGSIAVFKKAKSDKKWLRWHDNHEWFDLYSPKSVDDFAKFFGKYLKGEDNDWEKTPRVRNALLRSGGQPSVVGVPADDYPAKGTTYLDLFLNGEKTMGLDPKVNLDTTKISYNAEDSSSRVYFDFVADKDYVLSGIPRVVLNVSTTGDEIDQHFLLQKIDANGQPLDHLNFPLENAQRNYRSLEKMGVNLPYPKVQEMVVTKTNIHFYVGSHGAMRVSHRHVDESANWLENYPVHSHLKDKHQPIQKDQVTGFTTGLWPLGLIVHKGEGIRLWIGVKQLFNPEFPHIAEAIAKQNTNKGTHTVHIGSTQASIGDKNLGQSRLVIPVSPFSV